MHRRGRRLMGVAAATSLLAVAAGCGGDDGASSAQVRQYCDATTELETDQGPDVDFATASPEEMAAAGREYASGTIRPIFERMKAAGIEDLEDEIVVFDGALSELEETGDFEAIFSRPEVMEVSARAHEYDLKNCDWEKVDVKGVDYRFEDLPRTVDAGITSFDLENDGKELHEISIARKNDGVTETFDQILELSEEEQFEKVTVVGSSGPGEPGQEDIYMVADLQPGDYIAVCFLPQGAISMEALESTAEDAPPHVALGMKQEFTVEA